MSCPSPPMRGNVSVRSIVLKFAVAAAVIAFGTPQLHGAVWISDTSGLWSDGVNWSSAPNPPMQGDFVTIYSPFADITVTHQAGATNVSNLICNETLALSGGTLFAGAVTSAGGVFQVATGATLDVTNSTSTTSLTSAQITNAGLVRFRGRSATLADCTVTNSDATATLEFIPGATPVSLAGDTIVNAGTMRFAGVGATLSDTSITNSGAAALLEFTGATSLARTAITNSATLRFNAAVTAEALTISGPGAVSFNYSLTVNGPAASTITSPATLSGRLSGTGPVEFSNLVFNGTVIENTAGVRVATGGLMEITGPLEKSFGANAKLICGGTVAVTGTGALRAGFTLSEINIETNGAFDLRNNASLVATGGSVTNAGTFKKTNVTGNSSVYWAFYNSPSGIVDVEKGVLSLVGNVRGGGTFNARSGGTLEFGGGTVTTALTGAALNNAGTLRFYGPTALIDSTLANTGTLRVTGANPTFTGVALSNSGAGATLEVSGNSQSTFRGGSITNSATMRFLDYGRTFTDLALTNSGAGAVLELQGTVPATTVTGGTIDNSGTLRFLGGTQTLTDVAVTNSGAGATLEFVAGPTTLTRTNITNAAALKFNICTLSDLTIANTGTIEFRMKGTASVAQGITINGPGVVDFGVAYVDFNGAASTISAPATLSSGRLGGTAPVTFSHFVWSGGEIAHTSGLIIPADGTLETAASAPKTLMAGGKLINRGTVTVNDGLGIQGAGVGAEIIIEKDGVFDLRTGASLVLSGSGASSTLTNAGVFKKTGTPSASNIDWTLNNTADGTVVVEKGILRFLKSGTSSGTVLVAPGATLDLFNGMAFTGGTLANAGTIQFGIGTYSLSNTRVTNSASITLLYSSSVLNAEAVTISGPGTVNFAGATVNFNGPTASVISTPTTSSGKLGGTGPVSLGRHTWSGGEISNTAGVTIAENGSLELTSSVPASLKSNAKLINRGTMTVTGAGLYADSGAQLTNASGATLDLRSDADFIGGGAMFTNSGTVKKSAGAGVSRITGPMNNLAGSAVAVETGVLHLEAATTNAGSFNISSGATLRFSAVSPPAHTFSGTTITNDGSLELNTASARGITISGTGTVVLNPYPSGGGGVDFHGAIASNVAAPTTLGIGRLGGTGPVEFSNLHWSGGEIANTGGVHIVDNGMLTIGVGPDKTLGQNARIVNRGTIVMTDFSGIKASSSLAEITVEANGVIDLRSDADFSTSMQPSSGFITNAGLFKKTEGLLGQSSDVAWAFNNGPSGVVAVEKGSLRLIGGGTSQGQFQVAADATLELSGRLVKATVTTAGVLNLVATTEGITVDGPGAVTLNKMATLTSVAFNGPTASVISTPTTMALGSLGGTGRVSFTNLAWNGGTIANSAGVVIPADGALSITLPAAGTLAGRLDLAGTGAATGILQSGATGWLNILAGGVLELRQNMSLPSGPTGSAVIDNAGTLTKSGGDTTTIASTWTLTNQVGGLVQIKSGSLDISGPFDNLGAAEVQAGSLLLHGPVTQRSGKALTGGAWIVHDNATLDMAQNEPIEVNQGQVTLDGAGALFADVDALNDNQGQFTVTGGRNFTTVAALLNSGTLHVGNDSTFTVNGGLAGQGDVSVGDGSGLATLITEHIRQDTLTIAANGKVTIASSAGASGTSVVNVLKIASPNGTYDWSETGGLGSAPLADPAAPVPEPATWLLFATAASAGLLVWRRRR